MGKKGIDLQQQLFYLHQRNCRMVVSSKKIVGHQSEAEFYPDLEFESAWDCANYYQRLLLEDPRQNHYANIQEKIRQAYQQKNLSQARYWSSQLQEFIACSQIGVQVGSIVSYRCNENGPIKKKQLIEPTDGPLPDGCISTESPIGSALLGMREGTQKEVEVPNGSIWISVVEIETVKQEKEKQLVRQR